MHSRRTVAAGLLAGIVTLAACGQPDDGATARPAPPGHAQERVRTLFSDTFHVDRLFPSMLGPYTTRVVKLAEGEPAPPRELVWLTGLEMDVVGPEDERTESIEYECHTNLVWTKDQPAGVNRPLGQIFTLTQGQIDVRLPSGFGIPAYSDEDIVLNSQVLNLNRPDDDRRVRHRVRVRYVRDRDLAEPMKPLVSTGAFVMASLEDEALVYGSGAIDAKAAAASCHAGSLPPGIPAQVPFIIEDPQGRKFTGHWVVKPGRHEYRTRVTDLMKLPYDTTLHFIGVHVHPYSVSVELRDLTAGTTVWKGAQRTTTDRVGLEAIESFSSVEGVPLYKDHDYELVSVYDNPTERDSDAMASIFLYYLDKEFRPPPRPATDAGA
ncbi:MAG: hypothetical protein KIT14_25825 [bacterium]|nr:hypothetical protein [bacterium]